MSTTKDPNKEVRTEADVAVARDDSARDELRAGLATGSNAANPDQPDGHVIQTTVEGLNPDKEATAANSVVLTDEGKDGPAA